MRQKLEHCDATNRDSPARALLKALLGSVEHCLAMLDATIPLKILSKLNQER